MKELEILNLGRLPAMGIGCMGMSEFYGPAQNEAESLDILKAAYDGGIRLFDTADFYGAGANEELLGKFLKLVSSHDAIIATKCGIKRGEEILSDGNFRREFDGSPDYITQCAEASLTRLGTDTLDLFYLHRVDPRVPVEESAGAMSRLIERGLIRAWGLSEADASTLRRAHAVEPVAALQSEYSLWFRDVERDVLAECDALGVSFVAYAPLGRGIFPAKTPGRPAFENGDFRLTLERAQPEVLERNAVLYDTLINLGEALELSPYQVMLAWILARDMNVFAIPGMRRSSSLSANLQAAEFHFPAEALEQLDDAFAPGKVFGGRYTVDPGVSESFAANN